MANIPSIAHAPEDYPCPICLGVQGIESSATLLKKSDLVFHDQTVSAFINSFFNPGLARRSFSEGVGHVIVVPNQHFENLYDLPIETATEIQRITQRIAIAMRQSYPGCEGVTILQNNEPAGGQHAFHYHQHIFPRYPGDQLHENMNQKQVLAPEKRGEYAKRLRLALSES